MSVVQFPGAASSGREAPPVEVTRRLTRRLPGLLPGRPRSSEMRARGVALHVAFGAAAGAVYGILAPHRWRFATGPAFAGVVYTVSYFGVLPFFALHPPAHRDDPNRQIANALGHILYGLTLAVALQVSDPPRCDAPNQ